MRDNSASDQVFLRSNVKMELLVCRWFAWAHLISPVQHAMNIAFGHLPIMKSFVSAPQVHLAAAKDPKLIGAPFVHLPASAVPMVRELIDQTMTACQDLIAFARSLRAFDQTLRDGAKGYCLSDFYSRVPTPLSGAVEIAYDLNNNPTLRVIEEIIYKYHLDNTHTQEIYLSHVKDADRQFFMSTPRLADADTISLKVPFSDPRLDSLASMRIRGGSRCEALGLFDLDDSKKSVFDSFFTTESPERNEPNYHGSDVRVRYFGHACVLVQTAKNSILIDPMVTWDANKTDGRFVFTDLPDSIDFLIISHCHQDHFSPEMLVQLRHRVRTVVVPRNNGGNIADPSMALILRRLGYRDIVIVDAFDSIGFDEGEIISLPFSGEHADLNIHSKHTILLRVKGRKFFFLVDSDAIDPALYKLVKQIVGTIDASFVGMECFGAPLTWLYGPLLTTPISRANDESRRLSASNCERAWSLISSLGCQKAFIYAMGQEPWLRYLMGLEYQPGSVQLTQARNFVERCEGAGVKVEQLHISREMLF